MQKQVIRPEGAGSNPILSPGMRYGNLVFTAGQVAHNPKTGKMVEGGIAEQARQTLENVKAVLEAAGTTMDHVLKASCFIANLEDAGVRQGSLQGVLHQRPAGAHLRRSGPRPGRAD